MLSFVHFRQCIGEGRLSTPGVDSGHSPGPFS